jgi:7-cyano-7-deazaguanine synthase
MSTLPGASGWAACCPSARADGTRLVLFSSGQDSATCLAWACERFTEIETLGFDYGLRHRVEMDQRPVFLEAFTESFPRLAARLGADTVLDVSTLGQV